MNTYQQRIQTNSNTYIPVTFDDKENVFQAINSSLNMSSRQDQGKVPRLELTRTRSFSRQSSPNNSFRTQTDNDTQVSILNYMNNLNQQPTMNTQNSSVTRDYTKKQYNPIPIPSIPKPQTFVSRANPSVKDLINGTSNNLYNQYQSQRTKRSLSGSVYQSPLYDNLLNKQYGDQTLDYSQNYSSNGIVGGNQLLSQDSVLNDSRANIAKETDDMIQEYRKKQKEIRRVLDENRDFSKEVEQNLKSLKTLEQRKEDIMMECIKGLEDLYEKYDKQDDNENNNNNDINNSEDYYTTVLKYNSSSYQESSIQDSIQKEQNVNKSPNSQYGFSDFQERKSVELIDGDYSMSNYQTPHEGNSSKRQPSIQQFSQ